MAGAARRTDGAGAGAAPSLALGTGLSLCTSNEAEYFPSPWCSGEADEPDSSASLLLSTPPDTSRGGRRASGGTWAGGASGGAWRAVCSGGMRETHVWGMPGARRGCHTDGGTSSVCPAPFAVGLGEGNGVMPTGKPRCSGAAPPRPAQHPGLTGTAGLSPLIFPSRSTSWQSQQ